MKTKTTKTNAQATQAQVIDQTYTFGVFDNFANKLRMGFVSKDIKKLATSVAEQIVEVSLNGGEDTFEAYKDKVIKFKDAISIFEDFGFVLAIIPHYLEELLKDGEQTVVSLGEKHLLEDASNAGVKLLDICYNYDGRATVNYYDADDERKVLKGRIDIPKINSEVTWQEAIAVMVDVQKKHNIDLFAPSYFKTCSCCAVPSDFPKKYFLNKEDAQKESLGDMRYIIVGNAHNGRGASKLGTKTKPEVFGTINGDFSSQKLDLQYLYYGDLTVEEAKAALEDFVKGLNDLVGEETYVLKVPENASFAFSILTKAD